MRALRTLFAVVLALASFTNIAPAGAQYEGDSALTGFLEVPDNPGPGSPLIFTHTGLLPGSELTFFLEAPDGSVVDGIEVLGSVVVRVDDTGTYEGEIIIPEGLDSGVFSLNVSGTLADNTAFSRSFAVATGAGAAETTTGSDSSSAADGTTTAAAAPELAITGVSSSATAFGGVLIIGAGLALMAFATRNRSREVVNSAS